VEIIFSGVNIRPCHPRPASVSRKDAFLRFRPIKCSAHTSREGRNGDTLKMVLCVALSGLTATAMAQTVTAPENWTPIGRPAQTVTGRVTFTTSEITFQYGKSLPLAPGGQMLFRPEAKRKKVVADLYRVTSPDDPLLENGNKLCKGKTIAHLVVWKSEPVGKEADPRSLAPFSGPKLSAGSPDGCGRYSYDASPH
jgi:hypothetical protein